MGNNYSIWLVPEKESKVRKELEETISELSEEHDSPKFIPHITLLGGLDSDLSTLKNAVSNLAGQYGTLEINFQSTHFSTTRHQCNYLMVEPTKDLLRLHEKLRKEFGEAEGMYTPHLSLIYSNMSISEREKLDEELGDLPDGFSSGRIVIFDTSGTEEEWHQVAEFGLEEP